MRKTAVRPIGEPFYGFRKDPGRRPLQHSAVPARRLVSVLIEKFSSASFRRRPAGGEWARPRPEHPHRAGGDMYFQVRLDKGNCHEWIRRKQKRAVAEAECNTVTGLKQVHHAATPLLL
ncbi:hypothetical protein LZM58_15100, partial [Pseudomonas aeruginosa]|nr:hypothetical protein [Pseudomonas aeruginosa]